MAKKLKTTKVNPAAILNLSYALPADRKIEKPKRPDVFAFCPRCQREFLVLSLAHMRKYTPPENQERLDFVIEEERKICLDPDNECFSCYQSNRFSGWCCITDSVDVSNNPELEEYQEKCLRDYDNKLKLGQNIQTTLKLVKSPVAGEVRERERESRMEQQRRQNNFY